MRQLLIDDLSPQERDSLERYLTKSLKASPVEGMFWLALPDNLLGEKQRGHRECGPFYFGVELGPARISFELLIRSESNLHCSCIGYADRAQRDFVLAFVDRLVSEAEIGA